MDLSQPLPKGEHRTVYVVHQGTYKNDATGEQGIANGVCTRTTEEDAESIAALIDQAQEGVFYLRWVASTQFPLACGNADAVIAKGEEPAVQSAWEALAAPLRKRLYQVATVQMVNEEDVRTFNEELDQEAVRHGEQ